jgi:TRAP-type uncharacterized transport system fused permease subunit
MFRKTTVIERWALIIAGLMLVYPSALFDYIGVALLLAVVAAQKLLGAAPAPAARG